MSPKSKINLTIVFFSLFSLFLLVFLIRPTISEIKNVSNEIISGKEKITNFEIKTKNLENFHDFYKENEGDFERLDALLVNPEVPIEFISFLEENSQDLGLSLKLSPISITQNPEDPWPSIGFQISSAGLSQNFLKFLEKLELSSYLIEIQNLSVKKLSKTEKTSQEEISANFSIKVYTK